MARVVHRPVETEAKCVGQDEDTALWCSGLEVDGGIVVATSQGDILAEHGDWIVRDVGSGYKVRKAHIFEATYDVVED